MENYKSEWFKPNQLQEQLDAMKDKVMPSKTLFGDLNGLVPPYGSSKLDNMENPRKVIEEGQ